MLLFSVFLILRPFFLANMSFFKVYVLEYFSKHKIEQCIYIALRISSNLIGSTKTCFQNLPGCLQRILEIFEHPGKKYFPRYCAKFRKVQVQIPGVENFPQAKVQLYFRSNIITNLHFFFQERTHHAIAFFTLHGTFAYVSISHRQ